MSGSDEDYVFDEASGEWVPASQLNEAGDAADMVEVRDAVGNLLADGDQVTLIKDLVVKEVHGSGGYGMLVGPAASRKELASFAAKLRARPGNYIAQPTLALSTVPVLTKAGLAPRHVDLRPYVLVSPDRVEMAPGGLTRVALKKGSLVVNSSQGGGTKDTWVLGD